MQFNAFANLTSEHGITTTKRASVAGGVVRHGGVWVRQRTQNKGRAVNRDGRASVPHRRAACACARATVAWHMLA